MGFVCLVAERSEQRFVKVAKEMKKQVSASVRVLYLRV